ncbi:MAG: aromatic amino acid lyase [Prolixibacteraceae bacterium]|nr:aromatic amino acid lyase [Prolixibacteraceae bacterium]
MKQINSFKDISLDDLDAIVLHGESVEISEESVKHVEASHDFLCKFAKEKIIYGVNTGFGPMAQYKIDEGDQISLQYNLIRSHCAGAGDKLEDLYVKSSMLVRLCAISKGYSGIHPSTIFLLKELINKEIYPFIPKHGGVGASGDLVQLSHLALALIGEGLVTYKGELRKTEEVFKQLGLKPIEVKSREGLSLINGTSVMTGIGAINIIKSKQLLGWSVCASSLLNELVGAFDDYFSKELNGVKKHRGQQLIAERMTEILSSSQSILRREDYFYNHSKDHDTIEFSKKVQEYYSLRCVTQILGPIYDTIENAQEVIVNEINSVSDNPIIDHVKENVFHGGNFHGDYISLEMDKLKLAVTKMSMLSERQLAFLFNPKINGILPPFVNLGRLGLNMGMQGVQFTATSTVAENQMLSNSMYVHSITTNNDNQDIVSMGTNSALAAKTVIDNAYQVQAIEMIALLQAVDYLKVADKLSDHTLNVYNQLRAIVPVFIEDTPKYEEIRKVCDFLYNNEFEFPI